MNPFLKSSRRGMPDLGVIDPKATLGYIERHALPIAREVAGAAQALHDVRPTAATRRRAETLKGKAESLAHAAQLHRENLALSGLLDDYLREQEEFKERFRPKTGGSHGVPLGPSFTPAKPLPPIETPSTFRYFPPIGASDRFRFCQILKTFDKTARYSEATTDAVDAFKTLLETYPENQRDNIIEYIEAYCPMPDFFYNLVGGRRKTPSTTPYQVPGSKPVPTVDVYPRKQPVPEVPRYVPPTAPPVPSVHRLPSPLPAAPIQTSVPKESGMVPSCPPPLFWDGQRCRGSVTSIPTIPGAPVATVSPMVSTGPGLTMGGVFLLPRGGRR